MRSKTCVLPRSAESNEQKNAPDWTEYLREEVVPIIRYLELPAIHGNDQPYTVELHFSEPDQVEPGQRVFDIQIQGKTVAKEFDAVREAGGLNRALVRSFPHVLIDESLRIELIPAPGSKYPPVLCGLEVRKEQ